jgi:hypothetical protein
MASSPKANGAAQRLVDALPDPVQVPLAECRLNGMVTNDKFCMVRWAPRQRVRQGLRSPRLR